MDPYCWCGRLAVVRTSWTDANPGRRFWGCSRYMENKRNACNYHMWLDPPTCQRSKTIIPGLLRKIEKLEDEGKKLEDVVAEMERKKGRSMLVFVVVMLMFFSFVIISSDGEVVMKE